MTETVTPDPSKVEQQALPDAPPDGGYGWVIVLISFFTNVLTYGYVFSWGVFQQHYHDHLFSSSSDLLLLSFIGSTYNFLLLTTGLFLRLPLYYLGIRGVLFGGTLLITLGWLLASLCTLPWQLLLTQGVLVGLGAGGFNNCYLTLISQYFNKRRPIAIGIAVCGGGAGGFAMAPLVHYLLDRYGVNVTLRIFALMYGLGLLVITLLGVERIPIQKLLRRQEERMQARVERQPGRLLRLINKLFNTNVLKRTDVRLLMLMRLTALFAYTNPYYFIPAYADHYGLSSVQGALAASIMSGSSIVGRIVLGVLAAHLGGINVFLVSIVGCCVSCFLWFLANSYTSILVFSIAYGFASGGFISLHTLVMTQCSDLEDMSDTIGVIMSAGSIPTLFGPVTFAALFNLSHGTSYLSAQLFCGCMYAVGTIFIVWLRVHKDKRLCKAV